MAFITSKQQQAENIFGPLRRSPDAIIKRSVLSIERSIGLTLFIEEAEKVGATVHQFGRYLIACAKGTKLSRPMIIGSSGTPTYA